MLPIGKRDPIEWLENESALLVFSHTTERDDLSLW